MMSVYMQPAQKGRGKKKPTAPNQGVHPAGPQSSGASANGATDSNEGATKKPRPRNKWKVRRSEQANEGRYVCFVPRICNCN